MFGGFTGGMGDMMGSMGGQQQPNMVPPGQQQPFMTPQSGQQQPFMAPPGQQQPYGAPQPGQQQPFMAPQPGQQSFMAPPGQQQSFMAPPGQQQQFMAPQPGQQQPSMAPQYGQQQPFMAPQPGQQQPNMAPQYGQQQPNMASQPGQQQPNMMSGGFSMGGGGGGGMMGGGGGGGGGDDQQKMMAALQDGSPGSQAAQQAYQAAQQQGQSQGQCMVVMAEAYKRANGYDMPGAPAGEMLQQAKGFQAQQTADNNSAAAHRNQQQANEAADDANATVIHIHFHGASGVDGPTLELSGCIDYTGTGRADSTPRLQHTRCISGTGNPAWDEVLKIEVPKFEAQGPATLSCRIAGDKNQGSNIANYEQLNLIQLFKKWGYAQPFRPEMKFKSGTSQLNGKPELDISITFYRKGQ